MAKNLYRQTAHIYDFDPRPIAKDDILFFLDLAKDISGPILELACGTGRVTIPLATAGYNVWGLDLSQDMLNQFAVKVKNLDSKIASRIHVSKNDMADFRLDKKFKLIIIPFRTFQALSDNEQMSNCLKCVKSHLGIDGRFVIHVVRPYERLDHSWLKPETLDWEVFDEQTQSKISRYQKRISIDVNKQLLRVDLIYKITDKHGKKENLIEPLTISYLYEDQIKDLLQSHGFAIEESYGYFDKRPLSEGPEMIFVCKHLKN
jgi:SAM-dependent methyltransferase